MLHFLKSCWNEIRFKSQLATFVGMPAMAALILMAFLWPSPATPMKFDAYTVGLVLIMISGCPAWMIEIVYRWKHHLSPFSPMVDLADEDGDHTQVADEETSMSTPRPQPDLRLVSGTDVDNDDQSAPCQGQVERDRALRRTQP